ncbi:MAG: putative HTH-type transcriptional regulator YurK [Candidatus Accumulibacter regalis]|jgi:GntR family transcriptional regulator|uniref:HTH-type transcriptional regulator YurK n=2 Tax=Candidatus Accumulibacter TaxID=327159 RepID=A0A011PAK7_ACCRE|nr:MULTISPECIES: GntR family transcriptional regulator [unclassified Candidatus Accumulibacter]EXI84646.1 MAG: putative HTH-type transcriptional regulator YurK [Candidatus Accumulibacter regalis]MBL8369246.1 GntR family transcriptional regulator [Accumulibacter sp.]MBN8515527.1 GntR family transcriptional regulator [Accumulibacter sp.]MBO3703960.1 GntR family transcriptional regulator [Accumulibacter sp.]HRE71632.1 GntR family transcriptional regulator [Accumulibacter sp.]
MNRASSLHAPTFSPLYRQIKQLIMGNLESGEWGPGDAIPSESELAGRFGVSQGTVRKAIDEMAAENLLVRQQGKGTFVATHKDPGSAFRFLRLVPNDGVPQVSQSIPLECWRAKAGPDVARTLALEPGAPITILRRLLKLGDEPVVFDEIYLSSELFPDLSLEVVRAGDSLYGLFESRYGVCMVRADERLRAVAADRVSAELLQVAEGSPLLVVERVTFTYGRKPVEWRRGFYSTRNHHYRNELG